MGLAVELHGLERDDIIDILPAFLSFLFLFGGVVIFGMVRWGRCSTFAYFQ